LSRSGRWRVAYAEANRDLVQYTQTGNAADARSLAALIDAFLPGEAKG